MEEKRGQQEFAKTSGGWRMPPFGVLSWNVGGGRLLAKAESERETERTRLNRELQGMIEKHAPSVVLLQEVVAHGRGHEETKAIIDCPPGYSFHMAELIDSRRSSSAGVWERWRARGAWPPDAHFSQGNAVLVRQELPLCGLLDLDARARQGGEQVDVTLERQYVERVNLESGLYLGDRDTEPRSAMVCHFAFGGDRGGEKPLDVFVVNVHLTTLKGEREGIPEIDREGTRIRRAQLDVILMGIVSRYNRWRRDGYPIRGERASWQKKIHDRHPPAWILAGDFNFTPEAEEYEDVLRFNFVDIVPQASKTGTKARGVGNPPSITVDYIFAGPNFAALDPVQVPYQVRANHVIDDNGVRACSDHLPLYAVAPFKAMDERVGG